MTLSWPLPQNWRLPPLSPRQPVNLSNVLALLGNCSPNHKKHTIAITKCQHWSKNWVGEIINKPLHIKKKSKTAMNTVCIAGLLMCRDMPRTRSTVTQTLHVTSIQGSTGSSISSLGRFSPPLPRKRYPPTQQLLLYYPSKPSNTLQKSTVHVEQVTNGALLHCKGIKWPYTARILWCTASFL